MVKYPGADRTGKRRSRKSTANVPARAEQREKTEPHNQIDGERPGAEGKMRRGIRAS